MTRISFLTSSLSFLLTLPQVFAGPSDPTPEVEQTVSELVAVLYGKSNAKKAISQKEIQIKRVLGKRFTWEYLVRRAVGRNWSKLSHRQGKRVVSLTRDLTIRAYTSNFAGSARPKVAFGRARSIGKGKLEIPSSVVIDGKKFSVHYRLIEVGSKWQIYDLVIEGVSIVGNYRKQFDAHFARGNGAQLISRLEKKLLR